MTLLVFGVSGQIGSALEARRGDIEATWGRFVALGRSEADLAVQGNCSSAIAKYAPRAVINAAAFTDVEAAERNECTATLVNGEAPAEMARSCAESSIPFVHFSTDYVFDGSGSNAWHPSDQVNPLNAYGRSKLTGEQGIQSTGANFAIIRTSWVFSNFGKNFVHTMLRIGLKRPKVRVVSDQFGGPTPASALADAALLIAERMAHGETGGVFHLSGAADTNWADFSTEIFKSAKMNTIVERVTTNDYPTVAARPLNSTFDCDDIFVKFGIERPDWRHTLPEIVRSLKELPS